MGFARFPVPIPPGYVWGTGGLGLQAIWLDVFAAGCAPFIASDALR